MNLLSFSSIGSILRAVNRFEDFMGHAHTAPPGGNRKSGSLRLCGLLSSNLLRSFISISRIPRAVNRLEDFTEHTHFSDPGMWEVEKSFSYRLCKLMSRIILSSSPQSNKTGSRLDGSKRHASTEPSGRKSKIRLRAIVRTDV